MTLGANRPDRGAGQDDGSGGRERLRVTLLSRASAAVREAYVAPNGAGSPPSNGSEAPATTGAKASHDGEGEARSLLESDVRRFAVLLRAEGAPPESGVRRLKAAVEPVVFSQRDHAATDVEWRRTIVGDVVKWFVEAYYSV